MHSHTIAELSQSDLDFVSGGNTLSQGAYVVSGAALTGAAIATKTGAVQVAAGLAVVGLIALTVAIVAD